MFLSFLVSFAAVGSGSDQVIPIYCLSSKIVL